MKTLYLLIIIGSILVAAISLYFTIFYTVPISKENEFGITALVVNKPELGCPPSGSCTYHDYYLKINSQTLSYLRGYTICKDILCVKNEGGLFILLPQLNVLQLQYEYVPLPDTVPWRVGDMVDIQIQLSPYAANETISSPGIFWTDLGGKEVVHSP